jgi:hypothetical protein
MKLRFISHERFSRLVDSSRNDHYTYHHHTLKEGKPMLKPELSQEKYDVESKTCKVWLEFVNKTMSDTGKNYLTPQEWKANPVPDCDNDMRGRVEQFEILRDLPEIFTAYLDKPNRNGMGCDRVIGQTYPVIVWTGLKVGFATKGSSWRVSSYIGDEMSQFYARVGGREYTGRSFGEGMCITLRETAESKRNNPR